MGIHYMINVKRKSDDVSIAEMDGDIIKNIYTMLMDIPKSITINDLETITEDTRDRIVRAFENINKLEMKILLCKNVDIKECYEDEIRGERESIEEYFIQYDCATELIGKVTAVVSDLWDVEKKKFAFDYNAPSNSENKYNSISIYDVYLEIKS